MAQRGGGVNNATAKTNGRTFPNADSPLCWALPHSVYVQVLSYYILAAYLKTIEAIDREHQHRYSILGIIFQDFLFENNVSVT